MERTEKSLGTEKSRRGRGIDGCGKITLEAARPGIALLAGEEECRWTKWSLEQSPAPAPLAHGSLVQPRAGLAGPSRWPRSGL